MSQPAMPARRIDAPAIEAIQALIGKGRIQTSVRNDKVLHERQAILTAVDISRPSVIHLTGEGHDSTLEMALVHTLVYQEKAAAKTGRILPRLSFLAENGRTIMALVGLDGEQPFREALLPLAGDMCPEAPADPRPSTPVDDTDQGLAGLSAFIGQQIAVTFTRDGACSRWEGQLHEVRKGENFVNIIQPGFHLHLRSGAVLRWQQDSETHISAIGADGLPLGLTVERRNA